MYARGGHAKLMLALLYLSTETMLPTTPRCAAAYTFCRTFLQHCGTSSSRKLLALPSRAAAYMRHAPRGGVENKWRGRRTKQGVAGG